MPEWASEIRTRLAPLGLPPTREAEIVDELSQHLDDRYSELLAGGAAHEQAAALTLADFETDHVLAQRMGTLRQSRVALPVTLAAPTGHALTNLWKDLRSAVRIFLVRPGFAAAAVVTLALGIGGTATIFSVVYGVLLRPLPFPQSDRLVSLRHIAPHGAGTNHGPATFLTYRENQGAFEAIGAWDRAEVSVTGGGDPERLEVLSFTASMLPLLRVQPVLGRLHADEDETPGNPLRVILTYGYWQRRFGGAADIVGRSLVIDGQPAEVIGVLPVSFAFLQFHPELVTPMRLDPGAPRGISFGFQALARLKPGVTLAQANADVGRMIALLPPSFAKLELQPYVRPLTDDLVATVKDILWILLGAVAVVWLIACGNVANLFLVRAEGRSQELATRVALGASRARIARVLLSESLVLACAAGLVGIMLEQASTGLLRALAPVQLPRVDEIRLDANVLLFTLAISVTSGLLFGLLALLRFGNPSVTALKESGRSGGDTPRRRRTRSALVVGQVALAVTLLIVAALMIRTFVAMRQVDPGFSRPEEVQTFAIAIPPGTITDPQTAARTFEGISAQLAAVPGVMSVGLSSSVTMSGDDNGNVIEVEAVPQSGSETPPLRRFKSFAPQYFETMGNRLVAGRSITWNEIHERRTLVVVSQSLAKEYWLEPSRAIGKRVRVMRPGAAWFEIVGVVGDERDDGLNQPTTSIVYWPLGSDSYRWRTMTFAVRSPRVGTPGFPGELERAVWSVNGNLPLANMRTLDAIQSESMAQTTFTLVMLSIAAIVALVIGVVGIYGVIAFAVAQRTREIGVRMALGARARDVTAMFVRYGLSMSALGIAIGIALALALTRVMSTFLFGVQPADPVTYTAVAVALAEIAMAATYLPAHRASSVDPIIALRSDV